MLVGSKGGPDEKPLFDGLVAIVYDRTAGWSSLVARWAHNPKVGGSNPPPATNAIIGLRAIEFFDCGLNDPIRFEPQ